LRSFWCICRDRAVRPQAASTGTYKLIIRQPTRRVLSPRAPGWKTVLDDQGGIDLLVLRHTSGTLVCFSDEPGFLASIARESRSAFPVLVLQPHIKRANETREIDKHFPV